MAKKVPRTDIWPNIGSRGFGPSNARREEETLVLMMMPVGLLSRLLLRWTVTTAVARVAPVARVVAAAPMATAVATPVPVARVVAAATAAAVVDVVAVEGAAIESD